MRLLLRWLITAIALLVAVNLVPGITIEGTNGWIAVLLMAVSLGLVNALVRPILKLLTCPLIFLTLGVFVLVINAVCLLLASWLTRNVFGVGFYVESFWAALLGAIIVSVVSVLLSLFVSDER
jgi:putative membrane protein